MDGETEGTGEAQALTFGFSFPTLLGLLPTVVLIIALATVGNPSEVRVMPGLLCWGLLYINLRFNPNMPKASLYRSLLRDYSGFLFY